MRKSGKRRALASLVVIATACGDLEERPVGATCQAIVGGHPDARSTAVVSLEDDLGEQLCSGTVIGTQASNAVVLTAAHCLDQPITRALFGEDRRRPVWISNISSALAHPGFDYDTGRYDIALVVLDDAPPEVRALPLPSAQWDGLTLDGSVEIIGYGDTETSADNTLRLAVPTKLSSLDALQFSYDQALGGPCLGDSGGPALSLIDGWSTVVGVTSFGSGGCRSQGVSTRVIAALDFLDSQVDRRPCIGAGERR